MTKDTINKVKRQLKNWGEISATYTTRGKHPLQRTLKNWGMTGQKHNRKMWILHIKKGIKMILEPIKKCKNSQMQTKTNLRYHFSTRLAKIFNYHSILYWLDYKEKGISYVAGGNAIWYNPSAGNLLIPKKATYAHTFWLSNSTFRNLSWTFISNNMKIHMHMVISYNSVCNCKILEMT